MTLRSQHLTKLFQKSIIGTSKLLVSTILNKIERSLNMDVSKCHAYCFNVTFSFAATEKKNPHHLYFRSVLDTSENPLHCSQYF